MSGRKFNIKSLTEEQLDEIASDYPEAVHVVREPVYKTLAMLIECGAKLSSGKRVRDLIADDMPKFLKKEKP